MPDIFIAHPHRHHIYHLTAGCNLTGFKTTLCVPFYDVGVARLASHFLPGNIKRKARGYRSSDLNDKQIWSPSFWQAWKFLTFFRGASDISFFTHCYDRYVASRIISGKILPDIFITMQDYMPLSMKAAKQAGALIISDQILNKSETAQRRLAAALGHKNQSSDDKEDQSVNREILSESHAVFAPSTVGIESIKEYSSQARHFITPYGVSRRFLAKEPPEHTEEATIRVAARANTVRKGGVLLMRALNNIAEELVLISGANIEFILIGKPDEEVLSAIKKIKLPDRVSLKAESIPHADMPGFYRSCSLFVMPSLSESRSLACLEALASGLPCVVTPYVDVHEILDGSSGVIIEGTSAAIEDGLRNAFKQKYLWNSWGANGIKISSESSWDRYQRCVAEAVISVWDAR